MKRSTDRLHLIRTVRMKFDLFAIQWDEIRATASNAAFNVKHNRDEFFFITSSYLEFHLFYVNDFYINFIFII